MNSKVYRWCGVPLCTSTSIKTPNKLFAHVPTKKLIRDKWLTLARRNPNDVVANSVLYFCEDHFDLPNDMVNYMEYHVMGCVAQVRMKPGCMPHKFTCQENRQNTVERPVVKINKPKRKRRVKKLVEDITLKLEPVSSPPDLSEWSAVEELEVEFPAGELVEEPSICRSCLACARVVRLAGEMMDLFHTLTGQKLEGEAGLQVCLVCLAVLRRLRAFRRTAASAERALADILRRGLPLTEEEVSKTKIRRTPSLTISKPTYHACHTDEDPLECSEAHNHTGDVDIKLEDEDPENNTDIQTENIDLKIGNSADTETEAEDPQIKIELDEGTLAYTSQEQETEDIEPQVFNQEAETNEENIYEYPSITNSEFQDPPAKRARKNTVKCVCEFCSRVFKSNFKLQRHKEDVHGSSSQGYEVIDSNVTEA